MTRIFLIKYLYNDKDDHFSIHSLCIVKRSFSFLKFYFKREKMNDYGMKFVLRSMLFPLNHKCNFFTFEFGKGHFMSLFE